MSDMYARVWKEKEPKKKKHKLIFIVGGAVAACVLILVLIVIPLVRHRAFWNFLADLSTDTTWGSRKGKITCTYQGETFSLDSDTALSIYKKLVYREDVKPQVAPKEPQEGIFIDYGNKSTLNIWPLENLDGAPALTSGIVILYKGVAGVVYSYKTDDIKYNSFVILLKDIQR